MCTLEDYWKPLRQAASAQPWKAGELPDCSMRSLARSTQNRIGCSKNSWRHDISNHHPPSIPSVSHRHESLNPPPRSRSVTSFRDDPLLLLGMLFLSLTKNTFVPFRVCPTQSRKYWRSSVIILSYSKIQYRDLREGADGLQGGGGIFRVKFPRPHIEPQKFRGRTRI